MDCAVLRKFEKLRLPLNPPATADEIASAEAALGYPFPPAVAALYRHHNGQAPHWPWEYRLMPLAEVRETAECFRDSTFSWLMTRIGFVPFWSNDNSDYAGMLLQEPFTGLIAILEHDGDPFAVSYRTLEHFYSDQIDCLAGHLAEEKAEADEARGALGGMLRSWAEKFRPGPAPLDPITAELRRWYIDGPNGELLVPADSQQFIAARSRGCAWRRLDIPPEKSSGVPELRDMPSDFAGRGLMPRESELPLDRERVRVLRPMLEDSEADKDVPLIAGMICALTPLEDSDYLIPLLNHDDFYVAEAAATSLGLRRWAPAVAALERLAAKGMPNSSGAAAGALRAIQPRPSLETVLEQARLARERGTALPPYAVTGLVEHGCEVIQRWGNSNGEIRYRLPKQKEWRTLYSPGSRSEDRT